MDVDSLWTSILGEIELETSRASFASFFHGTRIARLENNLVEISCPNQASAIMLGSRFRPLLLSLLKTRLGKEPLFRFVVEPKKISPDKAGPLFASSQADFEKAFQKTGLNPNYTLENFAVSESNQMAHAAAQAVAKTPGKAYNPLFLWGSVGVGKTHLMQALGREALLKTPHLKLIYCTGEEFTNGIIEAIRNRSTAEFKKAYRTAKFLLVDDIQFIAGRESVQMEFFHTFNSIVQAGGQVVLTSDKPPKEIDKLEARLRSRFEGGLTIDISPQNFELRTAILLIKASARGINLPIETAKLLAASFEDVRALEGAFLRFLTEKGKGEDDDRAVARVVSQNSLLLQQKKLAQPERVLEIFASHFSLSPQVFLGDRRKREIVRPRQLLMYVLRQEMGLSYQEIGLFLGGRDHTTVLHGVEKITSLLPKNPTLRDDLSVLRRVLWG